jgi:hypothetical protein
MYGSVVKAEPSCVDVCEHVLVWCVCMHERAWVCGRMRMCAHVGPCKRVNHKNNYIRECMHAHECGHACEGRECPRCECMARERKRLNGIVTSL